MNIYVIGSYLQIQMGNLKAYLSALNVHFKGKSLLLHPLTTHTLFVTPKIAFLEVARTSLWEGPEVSAMTRKKLTPLELYVRHQNWFDPHLKWLDTTLYFYQVQCDLKKRQERLYNDQMRLYKAQMHLWAMQKAVQEGKVNP